jgi:CDP-diacylglycerol--serine O-phosphatidyltransferase
LKGQSINRLLPNILTVLALCAGMTAIRFGFQEKWEWAVFAVIVAGVFDILDGRIARLLGGTSKFGAELDSLSDFVSFGAAPAVLLYFWTMQDVGGVGWALVLLFSVCCALRLARFNIHSGAADSDLPPWAFNYFTGVPAPAGAGLVLLPMMLTFEFGPGFFDGQALNGFVIIGAALLMISRIPTYSLKQFKVPQKYVLPTLLLVGLVAASLASAHWATFISIGVAYLVSIPFSYRSFHHLRREAERIQAHSHHDEEAEPGEPNPD